MILSRWSPIFYPGLALLVFVLVAGCAGKGTSNWAGSVDRSGEESWAVQLPEAARESLIPLSEIFYSRVISRRFNSRATFEDPSMRQFFPTLAAYSDYYAALVDALDQANIRFNRPTHVKLLRIEKGPNGLLRLSLKFVGRNDLPLRWWNSTLLRSDEWEWQDGRWWVVPGKV